MINFREATTSGEVRVVQVFFGAANRRPGQPKSLCAFEDLLSRTGGDDLSYQIISVGKRRSAIFFLELGIFGASEHVIDPDLIGKIDKGPFLAFKWTKARQHIDAVGAGG